MQSIENLGLSANQWQFLSDPAQYIAASKNRRLVPTSTHRQFVTAQDILARLNGSYGQKPQRGVLLADDVGLGKTTVAALVAWVVASAGARRGVRILAPNEVMVRRWEEELLAHVEPLNRCAPMLDVDRTHIKARKLARLSAGSIQIIKHSYAASDSNLACDLLIVDEAHRAKGENTAFSRALRRQKNHARRVLILTATPFSIRIDELTRMLALIGGETAHRPVKLFSDELYALYSDNTAKNYIDVADRLVTKARDATAALSAFVIRHGIDDLPREHDAFGSREEWHIDVPTAELRELELLILMDRVLTIAKRYDDELPETTNAPRFHVGWKYFDKVLADVLPRSMAKLYEPERTVIYGHLRRMRHLRREVGVHSKMKAVVAAVNAKVAKQEKVVLFCHHITTAQELTMHLGESLPNVVMRHTPPVDIWRDAWRKVIPRHSIAERYAPLRDTFVEWLCSDLIRWQTQSWIGVSRKSVDSLVYAFKTTKCRHAEYGEPIAGAANRLFSEMLQSRSSRGVLKEAGVADRLELIPGGHRGARVLGVCESADDTDDSLFIMNQQPDTVISVFNSPFGPDVLVVTDKLSEGIDLHRYCRHLIHYELDPSPIRTVQRNGRLRRVSSWAAITHRPILYAYPAFRGTRDHRLVQIMKKRIDSFSLLLGGVQGFDVDDVMDFEECWRNNVISTAKARLKKAGGQLVAKRRG